ncbi:unnamed protein product [Moneuplotes crassus]|uniref:Uncharacterized protein n=1 Tax=Euplotes crassus TaxID=5936 RepID=A0AAD1UIF5_EUPCR|nr:unnamed protein product [Moneuplotes crassus]
MDMLEKETCAYCEAEVEHFCPTHEECFCSSCLPKFHLECPSFFPSRKCGDLVGKIESNLGKFCEIAKMYPHLKKKSTLENFIWRLEVIKQDLDSSKLLKEFGCCQSKIQKFAKEFKQDPIIQELAYLNVVETASQEATQLDPDMNQTIEEYKKELYHSNQAWRKQFEVAYRNQVDEEYGKEVERVREEMKVEIEVEKKAKDLAFAIIEKLKSQVRILSPKNRHSDATVLRENLNSTLLEEEKIEVRTEFEESSNPFEIHEFTNEPQSCVQDSFISTKLEEVYGRCGKDINSDVLSLNISDPTDGFFIDQISKSKYQIPELQILSIDNLTNSPEDSLLLFLNHCYPKSVENLELNTTFLGADGSDALKIQAYLPSLSILLARVSYVSFTNLTLTSDTLGSLIKSCFQVPRIKISHSKVMLDNSLMFNITNRYSIESLDFSFSGSDDWNRNDWVQYPQKFGYLAKAIKKCSLRFSLKKINIKGCFFEPEEAKLVMEDNGIGDIEVTAEDE